MDDGRKNRVFWREMAQNGAKKMPRQPNVEAHKKNSAHPSKGGAEEYYLNN